MTQEDKQLLLKDLEQRLPYEVKGIITFNDATIFTVKCISNILFLSDTECCHIEDFRPYLRPMSSMTEEEGIEYLTIDNRAYTCPLDCADILASDRIDWLNAHHFDYRGLIPKGLAIEVDKENNPYEEINL